ncbi:MAG: response regulator, partial [Gemmataceae bacterium]
DGTEAIEQFSKAAMDDNPFDVVLLDLIVPKGVGGESTLAALRSLRDDFIAIASSGYADHPVMRDPRTHGFAACLPKPFKMEDLEARMNAAKRMILG